MVIIVLSSTLVKGSGESYTLTGLDLDTNAGSGSAVSGACFQVNSMNISIISATRDSSGLPTRVRLAQVCNGNEICNYGASSTNLSGDTFFFNPNINITNSTKFCLMFDSSGSSYNRYYKASAFPIQGSGLNLTSGAYSGYTDGNLIQAFYSINYKNITPSDVVIDYSPNIVSRNIADITITNVISNDFVIIYNFTQPNLNTSSTFINATLINNTLTINGTVTNNVISYNTNFSGINHRFVLDDNQIYPGVYNLEFEMTENMTFYNVSITNSNEFYKTSLIGINTTKNNSLLEVQLGSTGNARIYYCNSSYTTGQIASSSNCVLFATQTTNTFNHSHGNSRHNIYSLPITNGFVGTVKVTSNSSFAITSFTGTAYLYYTNLTTRTDAVRFSNNNGNTWSNMPWTTDLHIHQYDATDGVKWNVCGNNGTSTVCSAYTTDMFDLTILPPTNIIVTINQTNYYYPESINIIRSDSNAYTGTIQKYAYYIYNNTDSLYRTINSATNLSSINYSLTNMTPDYYYVVVIATDSNNLTSLSHSNIFHLGSRFLTPCNTTITLNQTGVSTYFNWTNDLLIGNTEIIGVYSIINKSLTSLIGNVYFYSTNTTIPYYNLYIIQDSYMDTGCTLSFCNNDWIRTTQPCASNLKLITYYDTHTCNMQYNIPLDNGTYEDCSLPPNTDKELWIIIILLSVYVVMIILMIFEPWFIFGSVIIGIFLMLQMNVYFTTLTWIVLILIPVMPLLVGLMMLIFKD